MVVKIVKYDPIKGKGVFMSPNGNEHPFTYHIFYDGMISDGQLAKYKNETLFHPKFYDILFWAIRRFFKWL